MLSVVSGFVHRYYTLFSIYGLGSGKTLAYLAPVISELRREEAEEGVVPRLRRPRALVVLPSRDLASQVLVSLFLQSMKSL